MKKKCLELMGTQWSTFILLVSQFFLYIIAEILY